jgi:hypothetical protein
MIYVFQFQEPYMAQHIINPFTPINIPGEKNDSAQITVPLFHRCIELLLQHSIPPIFFVTNEVPLN